MENENALRLEEGMNRGIILAGGTGTRLLPLTNGINKHLLPVGREPMIFNPARQLVNAGLSNILIITGTEDIGAVANMLGDGSAFNAEFTYRPQNEPGGTAQALSLAEDFANGERIVIVLADTVGSTSIRPFVESFRRQGSGARTLARHVPDPTMYGIAEFDGQRIVSIEERPKSPKSNYAILGYFMYDEQVFDIIRQVKVSERGELEMTCVLNEYAGRHELECDIVSGEDWIDCGTFEGLLTGNKILTQNNEV